MARVAGQQGVTIAGQAGTATPMNIIIGHLQGFKDGRLRCGRAHCGGTNVEMARQEVGRAILANLLPASQVRAFNLEPAFFTSGVALAPAAPAVPAPRRSVPAAAGPQPNGVEMTRVTINDNRMGGSIPRTAQSPMSARLSLGGIFGGIGDAVTSVIPGGIDDFIWDRIRPRGGSGNGIIPSLTPTNGAGQSCPSPLVRDQSGICVSPGSPGDASTNPGGVTDGLYGPARQPIRVQSSRLECPDGFVLGKDDKCYNNLGPNSPHRKWKKGPQPLLTSGQVKTLNEAAKIENRLLSKTGKAMLKKAGVVVERETTRIRRNAKK